MTFISLFSYFYLALYFLIAERYKQFKRAIIFNSIVIHSHTGNP